MMLQKFLRSREPEAPTECDSRALPVETVLPRQGLRDCLRLVKPGVFYVIDDLLPQRNWPEGHAEKVPVLLAELDSQKEYAITPMEWASGLVVAVRKA